MNLITKLWKNVLHQNHRPLITKLLQNVLQLENLYSGGDYNPRDERQGDRVDCRA